MANTYHNLNIQCVFAVKHRERLLAKEFRPALFREMHRILKNDGAYPLAVNGYNDHVHVFFNMPVTRSVADHMKFLKSNSTKWINDNKLVRGKFEWQTGYAAFSYCQSHRDAVIKYIINQEEHHKKQDFKAELLKLFEKYEIDYDTKYLFDFF